MNQRMKHLCAFFLLSISSDLCMAQSADTLQNYILTRTFTSDSGSTSREQVVYYDGLGRPSQSVDCGITPNGQSLVTLQEYDNQGRKSFSWLPVRSSNGAACMNTAMLKDNAVQQFGGDTRPYVQTLYESSPFDRPSTEYGAGAAWQSKPTSWEYDVLPPHSFASEIAHLPMGSFPSVRTTDEDGHTTYSYTDGMGRTFLTCNMLGDTEHFTYLVYDVRDDLVEVHSPMSTTPMISLPTDAIEDDYSYSYRYTPFHLVQYAKLPGCDAKYYIYDRGERLIFSQDGEQRKRGEWEFTLPDRLGRTVLTGICHNSYYYADYPLFNIVAEATRNDTGGLYGYNVSGVSLSSPVVHTVNYYDDYSFIGANGVPASLEYVAPPSGYGVRYTGGSKGLLTGTVTARLDASGVTGYDYTAYYYDDRGRIVQTRSTNALGGTDIEYVAYNFVGDPVKRRRVHTATGKPGQTEVYSYTYDHAGRLMTTRFQPGSGPEVTLVSCTYDELGRLKTRTPHGIASDKLTYDYNIRGWLTTISGSKFSQTLHYTDGPGTPCYNGNISSMTWQASGETTTRGYKFTYDGLNRMLDADYGEGTSLSSNANRFTEKVTGYDKNGNILALQRYGQTSENGYGLIDNLTFTLDGNRLNRVDDAVTASAYNDGFEFKDAVKQADEYAYDANGNLTKDLNKNISEIQYNCLNLPSKVTFTDGSTIEYTYAADGTKLRTKHVINGTTTTTDYCGNVVYENGVQKLMLTEAGYLTLTDGKYHYYLQDHQGNNRVVIDQNGTVEETNNYYPFGGVFANSTNVQPYKYNGKELDTKKGLNWYDYGARHYDAAIGRFATVDPMAEKDYVTSPYTYCGNNPVLRVDKDGKIWDVIWDVGNMAYDAVAAVYNHIQGDHATARSHWSDLGTDALAAIVPVLPAGASKAIKAADKAVDATKAMERGIQSEKRVLKEIGEVKNTKAMKVELQDTKEIVTTIPDAVNDTKVIEIKDTKAVYNTKQIRAEQQFAKSQGKQFELITGEKTYLPPKIKENDKIHILRRKDLGPQ